MSKFFRRLLCFMVTIPLLMGTACTAGTTVPAVTDTDTQQTATGTLTDPETDTHEVTDADTTPPVEVEESRDVSITTKGAVEHMEFSLLPLGQVQATDWLKNQLLLQAEHVTKHFEELSIDCKSVGEDRSGWLGGSGENWERGTYYVRGLVASAYVLDDEALKEQAQKWIDWTIESQVESGAFGPLANQPDSLDYWPLMPMLMALEFYCDATGDERIVPFLQKYFAWEAEALKTRPLSSWAEARGGDNIFAVLWLYEKTGDESLLDLCKLLYEQTFDWESAYDRDAWSNAYHIVNVQESFKLFPIMYAITGDSHYLDVYYTGIENIYMASGRQDGMSNGDEITRGIDGVYGSETCAVVERMLCDEIALYLLRDATIADHLELVAYNALPQQLLPDGRGQVYFTMQNQVMANMGAHGFTSDGGDRSVYGLPGGFPCCVHNYQMGWPLFIASMWMGTSDGGLAVGAYGPNTVTATVGNDTKLTITQTTNYPYEETVTLTLKADKADTYPLYLRIPAWCKSPSILVNGHAVEADLTAGEYCKLTATWEDGDVITLIFPAEITATITDNNSVSIRIGAVLFALEIGEKWEKINYNPNEWNLTRDYPSYNITPTTDWNFVLENFNFSDVASNFTVTRKVITEEMRYQLADVPIVLEAKARPITDWVLNTALNIAGDTPISPVASDRLGSEAVTVRLVPYAFTRLRITLIPWTGEAQSPVATRPTEDTLLFDSVIVPLEKAGPSAGSSLLSYTLHLTYETPADLNLSVEINRKNAGTLALRQGKHTLTLDTDVLRTDRHNRISFTAEDGSTLPVALTISFVVEIHDNGTIRYEAEDAKLTGSAYKSTAHVAGIDDPGSSLTFDTLTIPEDGDYTLRFYYAAPLGLATHTVYVDGVKRGTLRYNENGKSLGWGNFDGEIYADIHLNLTEGNHTLRIEKTNADIGFAELDAFDLIPCSLTGGVPSPIPEDDEPAIPATPDGTLYEFEDGTPLGAAANRGNHIGGIDNEGDGVELTVSVPVDGTYILRIYYTAPMGKATHTLSVNGKTAGVITYGGTLTGWSVFSPENFAEVTVSLTSGAHILRIIKSADDISFAELDAVLLYPASN